MRLMEKKLLTWLRGISIFLRMPILRTKKYSCDYILTKEGQKIKEDGFTKLDVESIEMNDKFDLYTNNTVEILKIFTPKKIEAFRNLSLGDSKSIFCHIGEKLLLFLSNGENQFEALDGLEEIRKEYLHQLENLRKYLEIF